MLLKKNRGELTKAYYTDNILMYHVNMFPFLK